MIPTIDHTSYSLEIFVSGIAEQSCLQLETVVLAIHIIIILIIAIFFNSTAKLNTMSCTN